MLDGPFLHTFFMSQRFVKMYQNIGHDMLMCCFLDSFVYEIVTQYNGFLIAGYGLIQKLERSG